MQSVFERAFTSYQSTCVCPCLCVHNKHALWPKVATLFALLHACGRVILNARGSGWRHVCKSVCWGIGIPSPWAICGQTDPIMFVLGDQIGFTPSRPAACWCSFQPAWMDYSFHFMLQTWVFGSWCFWKFVWMQPSRIASLSAVHTPQRSGNNWLHWPKSRMWYIMSATTAVVCFFRKDGEIPKSWF